MANNNKLKIFISAYACEPNLGSEIGVGWNWVLQMSKYFELWVLTRKSNQLGIEAWLIENPSYKNINFIYFDLPYYLRFWKKGLRGVRLYYNIWQWCTNSIVKTIMQDHNIKIFHHLTYGNALWSVSSYGKKQFFVWGPIGGLETIPSEFSKHYLLKGRLIEFLRRTIVKGSKFNRGFNKRCENANLILCKTETTFNSIPKQFKNKAQLFTDVAVEPVNTKAYENIKNTNAEQVNYYAVGRLDAWRGFDLLIEAFAKATKSQSNIKLEILGKGSDKIRLETLVEKLEMESFITLGGQVSMEKYYQKLANCDVVVNPCLKEGAVTIAFDSMSFGKPLICINTGGYTRYFNNDYSVVIPKTTREAVIENLTEAILEMTDGNKRKDKGQKARKTGEQFDWNHKGKAIYELIISSHK